MSPDNSTDNMTESDALADSLLSIMSQGLQGIDLPVEVHGKYVLDPAFQPIIAKPKDFCNFEVNEQLIYLKRQEGRVLCIPKVVINRQ